MTRLHARLQSLVAEHRKGLIPFLTAGDPDLDTTGALVREFDRLGVAAVELGVPFTDPLADGPTIQASSERALASGTTLTGVLDQVEALRADGVTVPIVLMSYYNPLLQFGLERFAARCAGMVDGVIATDLPPEEADLWVAAARAHEVDTVFLLAPTSTDARVRNVARLATGFVYCVSRLGVTGERQQVPSDLGPLIDRIRAHTQQPIAAGFGFSTPAQVREVLTTTALDAVVVGSAIVQRLAQVDARTDAGRRTVTEFVAALQAATLRPELGAKAT